MDKTELKSKEIEKILREKGLIVERTGRITLVIIPRSDCVKPKDNLQLRRDAG